MSGVLHDEKGSNESGAKSSKKPVIAIIVLAGIIVIGGFAQYYSAQAQRAKLCSTPIESVASTQVTTQTDQFEVRTTGDSVTTQIYDRTKNTVVWQHEESGRWLTVGWQPIIFKSRVLIGTSQRSAHDDSPTLPDLYNLTAYDIETGKEQWSYQMDATLVAQLAINDEAIYLTGNTGDARGVTMAAIDLFSGKELWTVSPQVGWPILAPFVTDKLIYLVGETVEAYDLQTHQLKWSYNPQDFFEDQYIKNFQVGKEMFGFELLNPTRIYRLNAATGEELAVCNKGW